jgi:hypothetical protein
MAAAEPREDAEFHVPGTLTTIPTRVLVQTTAHLVLGKAYNEKMLGMWDRICQCHWGCDFMPSTEDFRRGIYIIYGTKFAYLNCRCVFLMDRGFIRNGEQLRLLYYNWTGSAL